MSRIVTFTNLFPSAVMPEHGLFVAERMRRVAATGGFDWRVVAPVPRVALPLRTAAWRRWAAVPARETSGGTEVAHPRWRHWPGFVRRQADAVARGAAAAVRAFAKVRPCVLDAHYLWPDGVAAAAIARELSLPYVLTARGTDLNVLANDPVIAARIRDAARTAFACCAVSAPLCERFAEITGLPRARVLLARNGVDLDRFRPGDAAAARSALGLPAHGTLLLGVGRLVASKGFGVAAAALRTLQPGARLVLIGDGPERASLARTPGVLALGNRPPDDVAEAYRACDLLVLPSEREGWPNVVTEALASGLRVVATRVGGLPGILGDPPPADRSLGALVPAGDADAFAAAVRAVLDVPPDRARVRAYAERFSWAEPAALLVDVFRRALSGEKAA